MKAVFSVFPAGLLVAGLCVAVPASVGAQGVLPAPHDVVQFSASATAEARQDLLSVVLRVSREGSDRFAHSSGKHEMPRRWSCSSSGSSSICASRRFRAPARTP